MTKVLTDARSIRIKGRSFLAVVLAPDMPFDNWLARLDDLAARSAGFFLSRPVVLDVSDLQVERQQLQELIAALAERNVRIMGLEGARAALGGPGMPPVLKGGREASDIHFAPAEPEPAGQTDAARPAAEPERRQEPVIEHRPVPRSIVINEPVRSGQSVIFTEGDVTVIGSVASGAEIIAGGSIHVYGALRGRAMAGSLGNAAARIFCRKMEAELLAIDGVYKMAEDMDPGLRGQAVQLWLEDDTIMAGKLG